MKITPDNVRAVLKSTIDRHMAGKPSSGLASAQDEAAQELGFRDYADAEACFAEFKKQHAAKTALAKNPATI